MTTVRMTTIRMKKRLIRVLSYIVLCNMICGSLLTGCGKTDDSDSLMRSDVDAFLAEEARDDQSESGLEGETAPDSESNAGALSDNDLPESSDQTESVPEDRELYIGNYTKDEYDALTLEEQDALRDAERKKVTPPYESSILPEYRELYDYNNAVIGYIYIDGTSIEGPVLQTLADYEYYLHRDIDGRESEPGCIILDADSEIGIGTLKDGYLEGYAPSSIQLVHGHNMRNGTMFGSLLKYADKSYADSHSIIDYDSIYEKRSYEVVCAFYSQIYPEESEEFKYYTWNQIDSEEEFDVYWSNISDLALYMRDVNVSYGDEIIVLSTCAYQVEDGRFAVVGVRKQDGSSLGMTDNE